MNSACLVIFSFDFFFVQEAEAVSQNVCISAVSAPLNVQRRNGERDGSQRASAKNSNLARKQERKPLDKDRSLCETNQQLRTIVTHVAPPADRYPTTRVLEIQGLHLILISSTAIQPAPRDNLILRDAMTFSADLE